MLLQFSINEEDALAFAERYLHNSRTHRRMRARVQWGLPAILLAMAGFYVWRHGFEWQALAVFAAFGAVWAMVFPRRFDARVRARMREAMEEPAYGRSLGKFEMDLRDDELASKGPLGTSSYSWSAVDRVDLDEDYVYIFLAGGTGYPIRRSAIGDATAQSVYDYVSARAAAG